MIEVMIERWTDPDGSARFLWSLWQDGRRLDMGAARPTAEAAESEAVAFCRRQLGVEPDAVTRL